MVKLISTYRISNKYIHQFTYINSISPFCLYIYIYIQRRQFKIVGNILMVPRNIFSVTMNFIKSWSCYHGKYISPRHHNKCVSQHFIVKTTAIVLLLVCIFSENVNGIILFGKRPIKLLENECESDLQCHSRKCTTRTDFICAAESKYWRFQDYKLLLQCFTQ